MPMASQRTSVARARREGVSRYYAFHGSRTEPFPSLEEFASAVKAFVEKYEGVVGMEGRINRGWQWKEVVDKVCCVLTNSDCSTVEHGDIFFVRAY